MAIFYSKIMRIFDFFGLVLTWNLIGQDQIPLSSTGILLPISMPDCTNIGLIVRAYTISSWRENVPDRTQA